jgi:uncharacterized protein (DUF433 family)
MTIQHYSPQEVAAMSGATLMTVQKAITARKIPARVIGAVKRRRLDETALLAFALSEALPAEMHLPPDKAYVVLRTAFANGPENEVLIGDCVRIDAKKALSKARSRLDLYEKAKQIIVSDPDILGGSPVIRGTRITANSILGRLNDGETVESILEDYPYLDRTSIEAAALYARANPPRGRPSGKLWRRAS